ncbi:MAG: hypothetical protein OXS30_03900 [Chloroflexota bacterium]|nr:hypothetical protein [Chloroflexota bacterium]
MTEIESVGENASVEAKWSQELGRIVLTASNIRINVPGPGVIPSLEIRLNSTDALQLIDDLRQSLCHMPE